MNLRAQIEALETLATLDASLAKLEAELRREGDVLSDKKSQIKKLEERFESTRASVGIWIAHAGSCCRTRVR